VVLFPPERVGHLIHELSALLSSHCVESPIHVVVVLINTVDQERGVLLNPDLVGFENEVHQGASVCLSDRTRVMNASDLFSAAMRYIRDVALDFVAEFASMSDVASDAIAASVSMVIFMVVVG
jgi:hypothetical protein